MGVFNIRNKELISIELLSSDNVLKSSTELESSLLEISETEYNNNI